MLKSDYFPHSLQIHVLQEFYSSWEQFGSNQVHPTYGAHMKSLLLELYHHFHLARENGESSFLSLCSHSEALLVVMLQTFGESLEDLSMCQSPGLIAFLSASSSA